MALIQNILLVIVIIVVVVLFYNYFKSTNNYHLSSLKSGKSSINVAASKLPINSASNNFAYSIWFYVKDWQYRLTESKEILARSPKSVQNNYNPRITLAPYENNIHINVTTYPVSDHSSDNNANISDVPASHDCVVRNFPLQKWVNLIVSLNGRTLDVYIDGKLVRTCVLPGVAKTYPDADISITPDGGFAGWTSNLQYWSNPLNPQEAYNVYKAGYGGSGLAGFLDKYKIKVSYLVDNVQKGSLTI